MVSTGGQGAAPRTKSKEATKTGKVITALRGYKNNKEGYNYGDIFNEYTNRREAKLKNHSCCIIAQTKTPRMMAASRR